MSEKIEYRVRPVTRYIVTRWHESECQGSSEQKGEFDNYDTAYAVAYALCKEEHGRSGESVGSEKFVYPATRQQGEAISGDNWAVIGGNSSSNALSAHDLELARRMQRGTIGAQALERANSQMAMNSCQNGGYATLNRGGLQQAGHLPPQDLPFSLKRKD